MNIINLNDTVEVYEDTIENLQRTMDREIGKERRDHILDNQLPVIQTLWIGGTMTLLEQLCISSFLANGHSFHLYVYDDVKGIPSGTVIKDANDIIDAKRIFKNSDADTYAGFSNIFRYKLLHEKGAYWVDIDIICLEPFNQQTEYVFANERTPPGSFLTTQANGCVMCAPAGSQIMEYCYKVADGTNLSELTWGQIGPALVTKAVERFGMNSFLAHPNEFCPINWWECEKLLEPVQGTSLLGSRAVHFWNEMWRRRSIDKNAKYHPDSIYERLKSTYQNIE